MPTSTAKRADAKTPRAPAHRTAEKRNALPPASVERTNLTPAERALLANPKRVTENEADFIIGERRMRQEAHKAIPLEEVLKRYGRKPRQRVEG